MNTATSEVVSGVRTLPEDIRLPEVSFDIRLGQMVESVDFDYDAYIAHLRENELYLSEIEDTKIVFTSSRRKGFEGFDQDQADELRLSAGTGGLYDHNQNTMYVRVGGLRNNPNAVLIHETQHRIDFLKDDEAAISYDKRKIKLSYLAVKSAVGVGSLGCAAIIAGDYYDVSSTLVDRFVIAPVGLYLIGSLGNYLYHMTPYIRDPLEVNARKAAKEVKTQFVTIDR